MKLEILTPEKRLFKGEIQSITIPGKKGSFTVLSNHAPLVSTLNKGVLEFTTKAYKDESITVNGGVVEVQDNKIIILAEV